MLLGFFLSVFSSGAAVSFADEIDANVDTDDDASSGSDSELSFSSAELREQASYGVALGLGATDAWQNMSLYTEYFYMPRMTFAISAGAGGYTFRDSDAGKDYDLKVNTRTVNGGFRYFLAESIPVYTQSSLGYTFWSVDSNPTGIDTSDKSEDDRLRFAGRLHGVWVGQQIGFQVIFGSGFSVDVSIIGFAKSFVLGEDSTRATSSARKIARKQVESPISWGMLNVRLGYVNF